MSRGFYRLSNRLGSIERDQFSRAFERFGLGELVSVSPVPFGLFGQNAFVTSARGEFIFRGAPHFSWQFPTEAFFASLFHERGVPAPWPYLIDESLDLFPWSYVIMPRMPGVQATDPVERVRLSPSDRIGMARALARMLSTIHGITMPLLGRFDTAVSTPRPVPLHDWVAWPFIEKFGEVIGEPPQHEEIIAARIRNLLARSRSASDRTTAADAEWAERVLAKAEQALRVPFTPCVVFEDYQEGNVVFRQLSDGWEVSGVFDLMQCFFGDGEADIARPAATYFDESSALASEFVRAYVDLKPQRSGFAERARVYMLLDRLIIWDYVVRNKPETARKLGGLQRWAERYVELVMSLV